MFIRQILQKFCSFFPSHIDCAPVYLNEKVIGKVLKEWIDAGKVKREDLFITTKLPGFGEFNTNE